MMDIHKIIIFGCNPLSAAVAEQLKDRAWDMLLVARDKECLEDMAGRGFNTLSVDYTDDDELRELGIGSGVDVVFAFFEDDARNVFLTISAKDIDPKLKVISLTQSTDSGQKLLAAGATKVVDPYEISGRKIYDILKRPLIAETIESIVYGQDYLNLAEVDIGVGGFMDGKRLGELALSQHYDLVVLGAIDRELGDEFIFASSGVNHKLDRGDVLVVIGKADEIERLKRDAAGTAG